MRQKFYIELPESNSQFVVHADNPAMAIALLWNRELNPLRDLSDEQLESVDWSALQIDCEYYLHFGIRSLGAYVHARCVLPYLTFWQMELAIQCLLSFYDEATVRNFAKKGN